MPLALAACYDSKQVIEFVGKTMGTTYKVSLVDHTNQLKESQVKPLVSAALLDVNKSMSNWDAGSEISRINAVPKDSHQSMSATLAHVMQAARDVNLASAGRFDTTVGPLIELWGFGAPGATAKPTDAAIETALAKSGQQTSLALRGNSVARKHGDTQVYLAGIGKGFGADHVGQALESIGIKDYMVEIGGDLYAAGRNPDGLPWQIGIETPNAHDRNIMGVVGVSGLGLASSGDYRNYFEQDGQRYSHLIDPTTGRPVDHKTASATVLAGNAMLADAWSTAMLILGRERGLEIASAHNIAVQFIDRDTNAGALGFTTHASDAFKTLTA
nr:FAD:protein FMN transferase [Amylibacter marinus]